MTLPLLQIRDLHIRFQKDGAQLDAISDLSLDIERGSTTVVLGESGSGKSLTAKAVMGLLPPGAEVVSGSVRFDGRELVGLADRELRRLRGDAIAMIFQDALTALNPVTPIGNQIAEVHRIHERISKREAWSRAVASLDAVRIPDAARRAKDYPFQFSGGMRQRAMIAMAITRNPDLLIADEPTTALDVTVQAQILELLDDLRAERNLALLLITHDIGVAAQSADNAVVMYAGRLAERGTIGEILDEPAHPYTSGLLGSVPGPEHRGRDLPTIQGAPPSLDDLPGGCAFHPRCALATDVCRDRLPARTDFTTTHTTWCHHAEEALDGQPAAATV
ncbi:ABC transporter ATP-binding protein [Flexivirga meconopsidis]|uniref:ABC transporter ATP-binding protein n=1 Tax=Flexivirga meconopsidis TaxID=2977121 RepID=UPI00223F4D7C|nr:ABC transporter ATP-binding protein [Flexivirga meconopsidis]